MNRASPEMLQCLNMAGNVAGVKGMDMSVLERQKIIQLIQQQQFQPEQEEHQNYFNELSLVAFFPAQADQNFEGLNVNYDPCPCPKLTELLNRPIKADPGMEYRWMDSQMPQSVVTMESSGISKTATCPVLATEAKIAECLASDNKLSGAVGRESFNKRKAQKNLPPKKVDAEEGRTKRRKGCAEEEESKITEQNSNSSQSNHKETNGKKNKEASGCTSKDNSKNSDVHKPDYIHVRARRGQATDSHSLAERVRREKISERMKYLQELVPGCNKITGKAGMLDEIINYVQSLQRQVEFLSMKLASINPRLDFNIDDLIAKEVFAACSTSVPTMRALPLPSISNVNYMQYNSVQQMNPVCGSEVALNPMDVPVSLPDTFIDPSCFNVPNWDADLQNIYTMEFQQGIRPTPFPLQTFTGNSVEASNLKMEM